ncbi:MAG: hypothetical protein V1794_18555, partial [Candidatus Glassbacteria bacterium]
MPNLEDYFKVCIDCRPVPMNDGRDGYVVKCDKCGEFEVVGSFLISSRDVMDKQILSLMLKRFYVLNGRRFGLDEKSFEELMSDFKNHTNKDKVNYLIKYIGDNTQAGDYFT